MAEESLLWKMGIRATEFMDGMEQAKDKVSSFADKMNMAFSVATGGVLIGFLDKVIERAGAIQDTADALQITTDSLQGMDYAAKQAGVSADQLHGAYGIIAGKAADAASGNKQVVASLEKLGINAAEFVKQPVDRQLEMIAKGAAAAQDKTAAFSAVADLIGQRNAPKLTTVLQQLATEGLDGVTESARKAGQVMSSETIADMDALGDRISTLKDAALNFGTSALNSVLKLGEGLGYFAADIVNKAQGIQTVWAVQEVGAKQAIASTDSLTVAIKGTAASTEELRKAQESQAKASEAATLATMDGKEKIAFYEDKILSLTVERTKYDKDTKEYLKAQSEIVDTIVKLNEERKKQEEILKKNDEAAFEARKNEVDAYRATLSLADQKKQLLQDIALVEKDILDGQKQNLDVTERIKRAEELRAGVRQVEAEQGKNEVELARLLLKGVENLTPVELQRLSILKGQTSEADIQRDIHGLLTKGVENLTDDEKTHLAVLVGQTEEIRKQIELVKGAGSGGSGGGGGKKWVADGSGPLGMRDLSNKSTASLEAELDQLQTQLRKQKASQNAAGNLAFIGLNPDYLNYYMESQINSVKDELSFRQGLTSAYNSRGTSGALDYYTSRGGDALSFDTAIANMASWGEGLDLIGQQGKATNDSLDSLNGKISSIDDQLKKLMGGV